MMTLCHLYKDMWQKIGKIKSLGYWLRLIEKNDYEHCHFLLLQMLHIALNNSKDKKSAIVRKEDARSREEIVWLNLRKFIKEGGFLILHNCMNLVFKELTLLVPDLNDSIDLGCENSLFEPE